MAIEIGGKIYRNLQEQVKKNKDDIEELKEGVSENNVQTLENVLTSGSVIVGAGGGKNVGFLPSPGTGNYHLTTGLSGAAWAEDLIKKTDLTDEVSVNEGMTVKKNGDAEIGRNLVVDGSAEIHSGVSVTGIISTGNEIDLTGTGFKQIKNASHQILKMDIDQLNDSSAITGQIIKKGASGPEWADESGGAYYSSGDGITINASNEISAKVGTGIFFDDQDRISLNNASQAAISAVAGKLDNVMTANGDIITMASGAPARLPSVAIAGRYLNSFAGTTQYKQINTSELNNDGHYITNANFSLSGTTLTITTS